MPARIYEVSITQLSHCGWLEGRLALPPRPSVRQRCRPPSTADPGWLSHSNISPFSVENKRPPPKPPLFPVLQWGRHEAFVHPTAAPLWRRKPENTKRTHYSSQPQPNTTTCTLRRRSRLRRPAAGCYRQGRYPPYYAISCPQPGRRTLLAGIETRPGSRLQNFQQAAGPLSHSPSHLSRLADRARGR